MATENNIIIYNTEDGKSSVALYAKDSTVWMNRQQLAELFDTSKQNIGQHILNILKDKELEENSVVKNYFTTASDGKNYDVTFYSLEMRLTTNNEKRKPYKKPIYQMKRSLKHWNKCLKTEKHKGAIYFVLSTKVISPLEMAEAAFLVSVRMKMSFSTCLL